MSKEYEFWTQVKKRRDLSYLWWIGWLPIGLLGFAVLGSIFERNTIFYMFGLLAIWYIVWILIENRLRSLLCPKCGKPAIGNAYFFMKDAKCRHCGLAYKDLDTNQ